MVPSVIKCLLILRFWCRFTVAAPSMINCLNVFLTCLKKTLYHEKNFRTNLFLFANSMIFYFILKCVDFCLILLILLRTSNFTIWLKNAISPVINVLVIKCGTCPRGSRVRNHRGIDKVTV